jgi:hypothetical protein
VPNTARVPILAPAGDENICPHWAERWEVRARPLGCHVSTITALTALGTVACTLVFVLHIWLLIIGVRRLRVLNRERPGWWRFWRWEWSPDSLRRALTRSLERLSPKRWRSGPKAGPDGRIGQQSNDTSREREPLLPP